MERADVFTSIIASRMITEGEESNTRYLKRIIHSDDAGFSSPKYGSTRRMGCNSLNLLSGGLTKMGENTMLETAKTFRLLQLFGLIIALLTVHYHSFAQWQSGGVPVFPINAIVGGKDVAG